MMMKTYQHWRLTQDEQDIVWLYLDRAKKSMNTLNAAVFLELSDILDRFNKAPPRGVVLASAKSKGFIAGADLYQFHQFETEKEAFEQIRKVQILFDRWEMLPFPTVALISGVCLGGGTEFALACCYRIADSDNQSTQIGLPEVKLGLHPGWGGTVRLPKLIGAVAAISIMLSGRLLSAKEAERQGLIDVAVPKRQLQRAAFYYILNKPKPKTVAMGLQLANISWLRPLLGKIFQKKLAVRAKQSHYPAPYALIRHWVRHGVGPKAMESEARSIVKLMMTPTARQLIRIFFIRERLKRLGIKEDFLPKRVHVIGAGTMGGDIAAWCAFKGFQVTLQDQAPQQIAPAIKRAYQFFSQKLKQPHLIQAAMDRLCPDSLGYGVCKADVLIEAVFEDLATKKSVFKKVEGLVKPEALLATNTSSLSLSEIATALDNPDRLVGLHFFNPVVSMPLVEVARSELVSDVTINRALSFVGQIDRLPLPVASKPGFLVNRILMPYLMEAMELVNEGVSVQAIDQIALDFGMPMGPMTLVDKVGLDICLSVAKNLTIYLGGEVPERLETLVEQGNLGLKTGRGFYTYQDGRPVKQQEIQSAVPVDALDRMVLRMVNEAVACLSEGVVKDGDLVDAGMVFGAGFAPFRGGVMQYALAQGYKTLYQRLEELAEQYGDRFKPTESDLWFQGGVTS